MLQSALQILIFFCLTLTAHGQQSRWTIEEKRGTVEVFAEFDPGMRDLWKNIADVTRELRELVGVEPSGGSIQIILFRDQASYLRYLASSIPQSRQRKAIFYQNGDLFQIYTFRHAQLLTDLRHEYTHALLHQSLPYVPLWVDEGLAEFLEERPADREKSSRLSAMRWKCRTGWKPSLTTLEKIPSAAAMSGDNYRDSWAYVHYLLMDSDRSQNEFREFLQAISAGEAPGAFSEWTASRKSEVANRIGSYFRRIQFSLR